MNHITRSAAGILATVAVLSAAPISAYALTSAPFLGGAAKFVVLGGAGVTCTKSTVGLGAVGSKLTVTKTASCSIAGAVHQGDATAVTAFTAFRTAYIALKAKTCPAANNLTGQALGGKTLAPGVYCFNSSAALTTGILTLAGPSSGVWVFQVGTGLTTATAQVVMANGGLACNVYWAPGTFATIGTNMKFAGNILAGSAVNFTGTNSSLVGRALAKTGVAMTGTNVRLPSNWNSSACHRSP
jgi:Ice-binding-like